MRVRRAILFANLGALMATGCGASLRYALRDRDPTVVYDLRVRLALDNPRALGCESACRDAQGEGTPTYVECLAMCEGAEIEDRRDCPDRDHKPAAVCYQVRARVRGADEDAFAALIVDSIVEGGTLAASALKAANKKK